jgi:hypothetical protein
MIRTVYAAILGVLILLVALIPPAILVIDKAGF